MDMVKCGINKNDAFLSRRRKKTDFNNKTGKLSLSRKITTPKSRSEDILNNYDDEDDDEEKDGITLQDLIDSGMGGTFVSVLTDVQGFMLYEQRETLAASSSSTQTGMESLYSSNITTTQNYKHPENEFEFYDDEFEYY